MYKIIPCRGVTALRKYRAQCVKYAFVADSQSGDQERYISIATYSRPLCSSGRRPNISKLDLAQAYLQIPLDEASRTMVAINTSRGLYRYNRLPFGVSSAPAIFQRTVENVLQGIPHASVCLDDILVMGLTDKEHLQNLDTVLGHLEGVGLQLKKEKYKFMLPEVE